MLGVDRKAALSSAAMRRVGFALAALVAMADVAHAQAPPCEGTPAECGKQEFEAGIRAYQAGNFDLAATHFERAHGHRAHPVVLFNWALAEARQGKPAEALVHLDQVLADPQTPEKLKPKVQAEREQANRNVARVVVDAAGENIQLFVDDVAHQGDPPAAAVNPGRHQVRVLIDGKQALARGIDVRPGETLRLNVQQSREILVGGGGTGGSAGSLATGGAEGDGGASSGSDKPLNPLWFYVSAGATVVLGGVTVWSALDTQSAFDEYESDLPMLTQAQADSRVEDGHAKETRTNILLGATAVAGVATAAIGVFFVDWSGRGGKPAQGLYLSPTGASYLHRF